LENSTLALLLGFGLAAVFAATALYLVVRGCNTFFRGVGLEELNDHKFEIQGANFKLNTVVSSAGGVMFAVGCVFGFFGFASAPKYEANLLTGMRKVTSSEIAIPRAGMVARNIAGTNLTLDNVSKTVSLSGAWNANNGTALARALDATTGREVIGAYANFVKDNPDSIVIVDYGGQSNSTNLDDSKIADLWEKAFVSIGITTDRIVVLPNSNDVRVTPTISVAVPKKSLPNG
jgi:hypothetical protein